MPILFSILYRPTKLLIEPAAHKSLKIIEVASRALASLLITERGICGNRAGKRTAAEATLATSLRFSLGERAKKIPTDKGWDFKVLVVECGPRFKLALTTVEERFGRLYLVCGIWLFHEMKFRLQQPPPNHCGLV